MKTIKITIDTKEDSKHEIRKAIQMLNNLVGEGVRTNSTDIFSSGNDSVSDSRESSEPSESSGNAFADMFGSNENKPEDEANTIDLSGFADLATHKKEETKEEKETDDDKEVEVVSY